ncbi:MAG: hypothetical protein M1838_006281 [Thelocarpon superellum]|nr:MAG: hypothetical protein M1838_006281 [Thelocarpon superellum]
MPLPLITSTVRVTRRLPHVYRPAHTAASFASSTFPRATPALIGRAGRFTLGLLTWLPIWIFVRNHVVNTFSVNGSSMQPLLSPDFSATGERDEVLASMWQPAVGLERGMIVAFCTPHDPERTSIKRVVALEGDVVRPRNPAYPGVCEVVVPAGHVWVEGSDGFRSIDSNDFGPVRISTFHLDLDHRASSTTAELPPGMAWSMLRRPLSHTLFSS